MLVISHTFHIFCIFDFLKRRPIFFENKIESLLKKGELVLPKKKYSKVYGSQLDYSGKDDFAQVFYTRYLRNDKKVISRVNDIISE